MQPDEFTVPEPPVSPLRWQGSWREGHLRLLDQTRLPRHETWREHETAETVIDDIQRLAVRGAPAIGIAGAYALVLAARQVLAGAPGASRPDFLARLGVAAEPIAQARPTAVNLPAAIERHLAVAAEAPGSPEQIAAALLEAAQGLDAYEKAACAAMGRFGAAWLHGRRNLLTHCNAGALVTSGIGTALAPIYVLHASGEEVFVYADESRPLLQGLRLTSYELAKAGVPHAVQADSAAAGLMRRGGVDAVIVGADRICANGDVVNKVGTYSVALAAHRHGVPFVVAAPLSTLDMTTLTGNDVPIEDRPADAGAYLQPEALPRDLRAHAPAFDVTPHELVSAFVSEAGIVENPDKALLIAWGEQARGLQPGTGLGR